MSQPASKFKKNALASAMALVLISNASSAMATMIEANVEYTLPPIPLMIVNDSSNITPSSVDLLSGNSGPDGNVFYHTYGNTAGNFGSRVSGSGIFDITGTFQLEDTYTNSTNISQDFILDFTIIAGEVSNSFASLLPGESLYSSYFIDVMVDLNQDGFFENTVYQSGVSISSDVTGSIITSSGTALDNSTVSPSGIPLTGPGVLPVNPNTSVGVFWDNTAESVLLGTIAAQDSFDFRYVLTTTASATSTTPNISNDCGEGGGFFGEDNVNSFGCNSAIARIGDPFGGQFGNPDPGTPSTLSVSSQPTNAVPEPASLALFGLGFSALLVNRRKKAQK